MVDLFNGGDLSKDLARNTGECKAHDQKVKQNHSYLSNKESNLAEVLDKAMSVPYRLINTRLEPDCVGMTHFERF
jgi:hypothetical protein